MLQQHDHDGAGGGHVQQQDRGLGLGLGRLITVTGRWLRQVLPLSVLLLPASLPPSPPLLLEDPDPDPELELELELELLPRRHEQWRLKLRLHGAGRR